MDQPASKSFAKFGFDTEFFEVINTPAGGSGNAAITHNLNVASTSSKELAAARQQTYNEAFAAGQAAGSVQAQAQAQADLAQLQQNLSSALAAIHAAASQREELLVNQLLSLCRLTLQQIIGHASQHYAPQLLEHHLRSLLNLVKTEEKLVLRIHPNARGYHEKLGLAHASIMGLPVTVVADASLGPTDALIEWQNGGVESKLANHLHLLNELFAGAGANPQLAVPGTPNLSPTPAASAAVNALPGHPPSTATPAAPLPESAASLMQQRAAALLGDDELVDALKS
jgi:flagellar biosynthesis/type III secretory pathway protein FliH